MGPQEAVRKSKNLQNPLSAYIHAHPLMIVGIDTIASDDGGHRGTGGGGGEEQGWIVGEGKYTVCTNRYVQW